MPCGRPGSCAPEGTIIASASLMKHEICIEYARETWPSHVQARRARSVGAGDADLCYQQNVLRQLKRTTEARNSVTDVFHERGRLARRRSERTSVVFGQRR